MVGPRDSPPQFGVPVNSDTGMPLTERQVKHLANLKEAAAALTDAMHFAEGSQPPDGPFQEHHWQSRRMSIAGTHLETALMFARKAALESP
jgi:hypothetical protein